MNQPLEKQNQPAPQMPPVEVAPQQPASTPPPAQKKSHVWIWILGGCLGVLVLAGIAVLALGWWGVRKAKKEMEKYQPNLEQMKENTDKWNREAEEWEKKSEEFRNSLPSPEDFPPTEEMPK